MVRDYLTENFKLDDKRVNEARDLCLSAVRPISGFVAIRQVVEVPEILVFPPARHYRLWFYGLTHPGRYVVKILEVLTDIAKRNHPSSQRTVASLNPKSGSRQPTRG